MGKAERTRAHIADTAMRLFLQRGFDAVTVQDVAEAAGVSHMTVFRHFPTKEDLVVGDPFDPVMVAAVTAQPVGLPPLERARRGIAEAWARIGAELEGQAEVAGDAGNGPDLAAQLDLIAGHPALRARMWESNRVTQQAIAAALRDGGALPLAAEAAAGAVVGALISALIADLGDSRPSFGTIVMGALDALDARHALDTRESLDTPCALDSREAGEGR